MRYQRHLNHKLLKTSKKTNLTKEVQANGNTNHEDRVGSTYE